MAAAHIAVGILDSGADLTTGATLISPSCKVRATLLKSLNYSKSYKKIYLVAIMHMSLAATDNGLNPMKLAASS